MWKNPVFHGKYGGVIDKYLNERASRQVSDDEDRKLKLLGTFLTTQCGIPENLKNRELCLIVLQGVVERHWMNNSWEALKTPALWHKYDSEKVMLQSRQI